MKNPEELQQAIAILGYTFTSPELRRYFWEFSPEAATRAWAAFTVLGWVMGAEEAEFGLTLEYAKHKLRQHVREEKRNNHHAS